MKIVTLFDRFLQSRENRCVPKIVQWYRSHVIQFVEWLADRDVTEVEDVRSHHVIAFASYLRSRRCLNRGGRLSPVTVYKRMTAVRSFFRWVERQGFDVRDVFREGEMPRVAKRLPKALLPDQVRKLLAAVRCARDRAILYLMLDSGMRLSEVVNLDLADVDLDRGVARVRRGKGDKERFVVFSSVTGETLRQWLQERSPVKDVDALFVGQRGRLKSVGMYRLVKRVAARAGLESIVHPHCLRHTFATEYVNADGSLRDLSSLMGHTDIRTTMIYQSVSLDHLIAKHKNLSPVSRLLRS